MGGAGRKDVQGSAITERKHYRTVTAVDADVDDITEVLDSRFDDNEQTVSWGAKNPIALYVLLADSVTAATLQLYAKGTDESEEGESSSSSPTTGSEWVFFEEFTVDTKNLLKIFEVPASEYKVMVTSITGSGEVVIREAHAA